MDEKENQHNDFHESQKEPFNSSHFLFKILSPSEAIFIKFKQKVSSIFNSTSKFNSELKEQKLRGRIHELQSSADVALFDLLELKKMLKSALDEHLLNSISKILDPLIKEMGRSFLIVHYKAKDPAEQVKLLSRYVELIEKSKLWIRLGKETPKVELEQAVIQQAAKELVSRVDRDIQLVQDYASHALDSYQMQEDEKKYLEEKLWKALFIKIEELNDLKKLPTDFSREGFIKWRDNKDYLRESLFGDLLHIVDTVLSQVFPKELKKLEGEEAQKLAVLLEAFTEKVIKIKQQVDEQGNVGELEKKAFLVSIDRLETEAFELNANLHLSHEGQIQVENLLEVLQDLRDENSF